MAPRQREAAWRRSAGVGRDFRRECLPPMTVSGAWLVAALPGTPASPQVAAATGGRRIPRGTGESHAGSRNRLLAPGVVILAAIGCAAPPSGPKEFALAGPARTGTSSSELGAPGSVAFDGRVLTRLPAEYVLPYSGRFARDPRFLRRVGEVRDLIPGIADEVGQRLGLTDGPPPRIRVRFVDGRTNLVKDLYLGKVSTEVLDGLTCEVISIRTESLVGEEFDLVELLGHEITHCFQGAAYGRRAWSLPRWVVEGMAVWGAGHGNEFLGACYLRTCDAIGWDPVEQLIHGLKELKDREDWGSYAEAYLAFAMIEEVLGPEAVRRFARELAVTPDVERALRRSTGLELPEFYKVARGWATSRVRRDLFDLEFYAPARKAFDERRFADALPEYDSFLADRPDSLLRPLALADRALCRVETGDLEGAEADLAASVASDRSAGSLNRMRRWVRMNLDVKKGQWADVEREAGLFLFDYDKSGGEYSDRVYVLFRIAQDELRTGTHWR